MHDSFLISSAPYSPLHWTPQTPDFSVVVPSRELLHVVRDGSQSCWNVSAMVWMMLWACWGGHHSSSPGQGKEEGCGVPRAELQQWTCWLRTWEMPKEGGELETYPLADILAPLLGICSHMPAEVRFSRQYQFLGISTLIIMDLFGNTGAVSPLWQHVSEAFPGRGGGRFVLQVLLHLRIFKLQLLWPGEFFGYQFWAILGQNTLLKMHGDM